MSLLLPPEADGYVSSPTTGPLDRARRFRSTPFSSNAPDAMGTFLVEGGHRLDGRIRPAGNKNAALPCLAASVLSAEPVTYQNIPRIRDVITFLEIVASLGAEVSWDGPNEVTINAAAVQPDAIDPVLAGRIRASVLLAGPLLARFGRV